VHTTMLSLVCVACAGSRTIPQPRLDVPVLVEGTPSSLPELSRKFDPYLVTGAAWVPGQPILVNRDFDFGYALSMDASGPALAARRRQEENSKRAALIAPQTTTKHRPWSAIVCHTGAVCDQIAGTKGRLYGLLFGGDSARLQLILTLESKALTYSVVGEERRVSDLLVGEAFEHEIETGLEVLMRAISSSVDGRGAVGRCDVGGTAALTGQQVGGSATHVTLRIEAAEGELRVLCPRTAFHASVAPHL
jgi:hypothetical protein